MMLCEAIEMVTIADSRITVYDPYSPTLVSDLRAFFESQSVTVRTAPGEPECEGVAVVSAGGQVSARIDLDELGSTLAQPEPHEASPPETPSTPRSVPEATSQSAAYAEPPTGIGSVTPSSSAPSLPDASPRPLWTLLSALGSGRFNSLSVEQLLMMTYEIERHALAENHGALYAGFQSLDAFFRQYHRYRDLGRSRLDVHVYATPTTLIPEIDGVRFHPSVVDEIANTWFVVYHGDDSATVIAEDLGNRLFRGCWTTDDGLISSLVNSLREQY